MKTLTRSIVVAGALAAPAFAQDAPSETAALLDALTCREFLALEAQDQMTVMLALRAHSNGDALPDEPLPIGLDAESDASGDAGAEGLDTEADAAEVVAEAAAGEPAGEGEGQDGTDVPDESGIVDGENESGKVNPDGTEVAATDEPGDPKLTAMRTSCEGGPEALALDALRAAHADYE